MKKLVLLALLALNSLCVLVAQSYQPVFMVPEGETSDGSPIFREMTEKDEVFFRAKNKFARGFMAESTYLYGMIQNYLVNTGKIKEPEPVYLAFTDNVGGFGKFGFTLLTAKGEKIAKPDAGYIDLNKSVLDANPATVSSYTQIYPHELGHLMLKHLSGEGVGFASSVHYFCTVTDYVTAFSEGFSEHFENVAVDVEPDGRIKKTIEQDIRDINKGMSKNLYGYTRDNSWPFRLGYYQLTMPMWFQRLENMKRHLFVDSRLVIYNTRMVAIKNPWKYILYRNSACWPEPRLQPRTPSQAAANEGVVSAFFTRLARNKDLKTTYYPNLMYAPFIKAGFQTDSLIHKEVIPLRNFYLKVFLVLNEYVRMDNAAKAPIVQFIEGYCAKFPEEKEKVLKIWAEASGRDFLQEPPLPEIWILNKNAKHYPWPMAQFGPTISVYSINLNTADSVDFMTFKGVKPEEATAIINWRNKSGGFKALSDISLVEGISAETKAQITSANFDKEYFANQLNNPSFKGLITSGLWQLLKTSLIWFVVLAILLFLIARLAHFNLKPISYVYLFGKIVLSVLVGLLILMLTKKTVLFFGLYLLVVLGIKFVINRKKGKKRWFSLGSFLAVALFVMYSLY